MKILVTGGAGFIASHIVDRYIAEGHDVAVVDNLVTGKMKNLNPRARFYQLDIRDREIEKVFSRERPDVVNHHAAQIDVRKSIEDPVSDAETNIVGMLHLLQQAVKVGTRRFIFASSGGAMYGEQPEGTPPAGEETPQRPINPYGVAKTTGELYLHYYHLAHGSDYIALRYANVYGPRQDPFGEGGVVAIFARKLLAGEQPVIYGDGLQTRDFVFVGDVAEANALALKAASGSYNIATAIETDVVELFRSLAKLTGSSLQEVHGPAIPGEQRRSVLNPEKAREYLGWKAQTTLEEGLRRTVAYFRPDPT